MAIAPARPNIVQPAVSGGGSFTAPTTEVAEEIVRLAANLEKSSQELFEVSESIDKAGLSAEETKEALEVLASPQKEVVDVKLEVPDAIGGVGNDEQSGPDPVVEKKTPKPKSK